MPDELVNNLKTSEDPSVRYILLRDYFGMDPNNREMKQLRQDVKISIKVRQMLDERNSEGVFPWHAYAKWRGAFWVLLQLVDLEYPPGDVSLIPLRDQVLRWLLDEERLKRVPLTEGRYRRCALQEATAVLSMIKLDLIDPRIEQLVELLLKWQWSDGGWNCDKKPQASHSSFYESWLPLRAMHAYAELTGNPLAVKSADRASELFLKRKLFKRLRDGEVIYEGFTRLAYPAYWHYDILTGLMTMQEIGKLKDERCADALDLLSSKQLPQGGFAAEVKYYRVTNRATTGVTNVHWGPVSKSRMNEYVTVRALGVLRQANRLK